VGNKNNLINGGNVNLKFNLQSTNQAYDFCCNIGMNLAEFYSLAEAQAFISAVNRKLIFQLKKFKSPLTLKLATLGVFCTLETP